MGERYQNKWLLYLPWSLLGIRTAFNDQLKTSSAEMTFAMHPRVPGCILQDPDELEQPDLQKLLQNLQIKDNKVAIPTSTKTDINPQNTLSDKITHVYTRQHDVKGLGSRFAGPFPVLSKPSRSTVEIKVGTNRDGSNRVEIRHLSDIKTAYLREDATEASRPRRGRPRKPQEVDSLDWPELNDPSAASSSSTSPNQNNDGNLRQSNSPNLQQWVANFDFSIPPPLTRAGNSNSNSPDADPAKTPWSATSSEIVELNRKITRGNNTALPG